MMLYERFPLTPSRGRCCCCCCCCGAISHLWPISVFHQIQVKKCAAEEKARHHQWMVSNLLVSFFFLPPRSICCLHRVKNAAFIRRVRKEQLIYKMFLWLKRNSEVNVKIWDILKDDREVNCVSKMLFLECNCFFFNIDDWVAVFFRFRLESGPLFSKVIAVLGK